MKNRIITVQVMDDKDYLAMDEIFPNIKKEDLKKLLKGIAIACIGPVTSRTVKELGMKVHIQPKEYTILPLAQPISEYFKNKILYPK